MSLRPLIVICGTTGVGKSKLAIELALALANKRYGEFKGARIINADAMQVYAGIDILTNKVSAEEQCGVDHLLMGFKHPSEQYVVGQWVKDAIHLIEETHQRGQIPIVAGGTSYWIQHLIFPGRLATSAEDVSPIVPVSSQSSRLAAAVGTLTPDLLSLYHTLPTAADDLDADSALTLHRLLASLDPPVAQRWHWKDTRKVLRSLDLTKQLGRLPSEIIAEQSLAVPPPRYHTLCFWLYAIPELLNPRLDTRVDQMLEQGLLQEVQDLMEATARSPTPTIAPGNDSDGNTEASATADYTLGIYQSIGYKEFSSFLTRDRSLPATEREKAFQAAVERMKTSTRQYAKRQVSWLRNKLLPAARKANKISREDPDGPGDVVPTFLLDASELGDKWATDVQQMAGRITEDFLEKRPLPDPLGLSETAQGLLAVAEKPVEPGAVLTARRKVVCPICTVGEREPVMIEEGDEWKAHERSRKHRRLAAKRKRPRERGGLAEDMDRAVDEQP